MLSSGIFLALSIATLVFAYNRIDTSQTQCGTEFPYEVFCGTKSDYHPDTEEGRSLFLTNCAACHQKYKRRTGPALAQIDSTTFLSWLSIDAIKIDSTKFSDFGIDYHKVSWGTTLNKEEVSQIIDYCIRAY